MLGNGWPDSAGADHIVDDGGNWAFGQGHLVVVGDVFDRGDEVTEILWQAKGQ